MSKQNLFIVPYTTETEYKSSVKSILSLLKDNVTTDQVLLTEGEHAYIHKIHDVIDYAKEYDFEHRNHDFIRNSMGIYKNVKYIVCIGVWSGGIISNCFSIEHPDLTIIHIQGPLFPNMYKLDKFESLDSFEVSLNQLNDILISQFHQQ